MLACCGLDRLGLADEIGLRIPRRHDAARRRRRARSRCRCAPARRQLVAHADHAETRRRVEAERACVATVGAGCLAPVAAHHDGEQLTALIAAEDGSWVELRSGDDPPRSPPR